MKLAAKLVAVVVLMEIAVLLAIDGHLAVQREKRLFQSDMQQDAHVLGNVLKDFVAETWKSEGQERAAQLLDKANREQHQLCIRWVWLGGSSELHHRALAPDRALASVSQGQELTVPVTDQRGRRHVCTYVPIALPSSPAAAIELAEPLSQLDTFAGAIAARNLVLGLVLASAGGASVISLGIVLVGRPLHALAEKARRIGQGDLTPLLNPRGHDELAELAQSMNDMCRQLAESQEHARREQERRLAAIEQLQRADRLRIVGQLAAGVAHELGTPLNTISIRADMIASGELAREESQENARIIKSQSQRMTAIIRRLLDYARPRPPKRALIDLRNVARDTITLLTPLGRKDNASITLCQTESACAARVDVDQIEQVLANLLVNALQAGPAGGRRVEVDVRHKQAARPNSLDPTPSQYVRISIRDNGEGIAKENLPNVFDPFFTTKDVGEGTGLGLSIAFGIVQDHGGWIDVTSRLGGGSCFAVHLPVAAQGDERRIRNAEGNENLE